MHGGAADDSGCLFDAPPPHLPTFRHQIRTRRILDDVAALKGTRDADGNPLRLPRATPSTLLVVLLESQVESRCHLPTSRPNDELSLVMLTAELMRPRRVMTEAR